MNTFFQKLIFLFFATALVVLTVSGQVFILPPGGYKNLQELQQKTPTITYKCRIILRSEEEIIKKGGNDFKVESVNNSSGKWQEDNSIYGFSDGDYLYMNGKMLGLPPGFVQVVSQGKFMLFLSASPNAKNETTIPHRQIKPQVTLILNDEGGKIRKKIYYSLDISTGAVKIIDKFYVNNLLDKFPDLKNEFQSDPENGNMETILNYMKRLNSM
jgi:hypothetical protein